MSKPNESARGAFDIESLVPQEPFMRVFQFATWMSVSYHHVVNLIKSGDLKVPEELQKSAPSKRAMRIPRAAVVEFLNARRNLKAVAAANPKPKYNKASVRRPRSATASKPVAPSAKEAKR